MSRKKVIVAALIVIAAAVVVWRLASRPAARPDELKVSGTIEVTDVEVSFKVSGRVKERLVDEGDRVAAGQVIARLEDEDQLHELAEREAEVRAAAAALAELRAGSRPEEIAQAEAALQRVRAEEERLRVDFSRQQELFRKEVIAAREMDTARSRYDTARASVRENAEKLALVRRGPRRETIDQSHARLQDAEVAVARAKTKLGYTTVVSPVAGFVLSKNVEAGELVAAGTPVVTVGDLSSVWLRAYVSETDLGRVKLGQPARVTSDTWPGKAYDGRVTFISSSAEFTPKSVQTQKERVRLVYRIKITIPNPAAELKPGMPADGTILLAAGERGQKGTR